VTTLNRIVIGWSGAPVVGLAVNVLHYSGSEGDAAPVAAIKAAYAGLAGLLPNNVTITVPTSGERIDDTTGELTGVWTSTGGGTVVGSGTSYSAAGVGACVGWQTGGIVNGRRLKGRTFLVPLGVQQYDSDGTLQTGTLATLTTYATAMLASGPLAVWHRPTSSAAADGTSYGVQTFKIRDKVAYLSSRRD
jgi:hypothetical protein